MEIDLKNPTTDQIEALKTAAPELAASMGLVDPAKEITREQAEALKFTRKVSGEDVTNNVWEISQEASKGQGADVRLREAGDLVKKAEGAEATMAAQERFRTALAAKEMPETTDIKTMADSLGVPVDQFMASLEPESGTEKKGKPAANGDPEPFKPGPNSITLEMLPADLRDDIVYLREQKGAAAQSELDKLIHKSLDSDEKVTKLIEQHGGDKDQVAAYRESLFENSKLRITGRISTMPKGASAADLNRAIDESVSEAAENSKRAGIPGKSAPQPIYTGPSEAGGHDVKILSDDKIKTDLPFDHPDYVNNQTLIAQLARAKVSAEEAAAPT